MKGGSSLQAPKDECLQQHVLMDPELLVPEISTNQASRTDQLFSENQESHKVESSHPLSSSFSLMTSVTS